LSVLGLSGHQQAAIGEAASHGTLDPSLLRSLAPATRLQVTRAFASSFMDGFHVALAVGGGVLLLAAVVAFVYIPSGAHHRDEPETQDRLEPVPVEV
jgi:hypothetical protein